MNSQAVKPAAALAFAGCQSRVFSMCERVSNYQVHGNRVYKTLQNNSISSSRCLQMYLRIY